MNTKKTVITAMLVTISFAPLMAYAVDTDKLKADAQQAGSDISTAAKDSTITAKVKVLYAAESDIPSLKISVTTNDGVVYLNGRVETALQANRAIEIAQGVSGVKDVDHSKLKIESSASFLNDAVITAKVKGKLLQLSNDGKISNKYDLHVETTNGNVHIFGNVGNSQDVKTVEAMAKSVEDVQGVKTNIDVSK